MRSTAEPSPALGNPLDAGPALPTDHYLPPEIPGYIDRRSYPLAADPAHARALAQGGGRTAILYTCDLPPCAQQAQILKTDLAAIGLQLQIKQFSIVEHVHTGRHARRARYDIGFAVWIPDYPDPGDVLGPLLTSGTGPAFADPAYQRRLAQAAQLTGLKRYQTYGKPRPRPRPQRRSAHRLRQLEQPGLLLRAHRLPDLRRTRRGPRRTLHQTRLAANTSAPHYDRDRAVDRAERAPSRDDRLAATGPLETMEDIRRDPP